MAEGGPGRSRNFWGSRYGPRPWESRVCKFYLQGNCYYGENCRFRHIDYNQRVTQEDLASRQGGQNDSRTQNQPIFQRERKPQQTSDESVAESSFSLGACSKSSDQDRVHAPEFVPSETHTEPVSSCAARNSIGSENEVPNSSSSCSQECKGPHGIAGLNCNKTTSGPTNEVKKTKHASVQECIKKHERGMEASVAIQRSRDKACGICFEVIVEKSDGGRKFGILPNCNHCFCLACIRKWRRANDFDNEITRACPECRVSSDFVCPSFYWVESKEEKDKLITDYKGALSEKDCKYFRNRNGRCPFGEKCFYKHTYVPGTQTGAQRPFRRRRRNVNVEVAVSRLIYLWDFITQDHDSDWSFDLEDLEPGHFLFSDSDDSNFGW